jgi:hypothetical protein
MKMSTIGSVLSLYCALGYLLWTGVAHGETKPLTIGCVSKELAYAVELDSGAWVDLLKIRYTAEDAQPCPADVYCGPRMDLGPHRWRIRYGQFWGVQYFLPVGGLKRIPLEHLPGFRYLRDRKPTPDCPEPTLADGTALLPEIPGETRPLFQAFGERKKGFDGDVNPKPERFMIDNPELDKIPLAYWKKSGHVPLVTGFKADPVVEGAYVDCLPLNEKSLLLFLLWEQELRAWRAEWKDLEDRKKTYVEWSDKPVLKIATDIHEPFVLYGTPSRLFIVTESGALHLCLNAEKGGRKTEPLWTGDPRPIRVIISDTASGKDFAFAPAPKGSAKEVSSVYFEITDDLEPVVYDAAKLKEYKPEEQLKTVVEHARLLLADKKIKP